MPHDDYSDAMAYLKERQREMEYNEALRRINPAMLTGQAMNTWPHLSNSGAQAMGAVNQVWPSNPGMDKTAYPYDATTRQFAVEKVDNGFIIRSGKYSKICKDMTELSEQFVAIMVEAQLDK
jgi:hypothetical protein